MLDLTESLLENQYIGYEQLFADLSTLLIYPPPFIYINDPISPRTTSLVVESVLRNFIEESPGPSTRIRAAKVNAISCFSARLLYDSILNSLATWESHWDDGCPNWSIGGDGPRWNENFDGFIHGLHALCAHLRDEKAAKRGKGKQKERDMGDMDRDVQLVIAIEKAERLKDGLPDLLVPLTRLAELTRIDLTVIFISESRWEDIRPPLGASPDPYFLDVSPPTKETISHRITSKFPSMDDDSGPGPYHPSLKTLYSHFISVLCDVCFPFIHDPQELEYIAAARWPGFVQPVLDEHERETTSLQHPNSEGEMDQDDVEPAMRPPTEDVRMRLSRMFNSSLSIAMEELYPRLATASNWALDNQPEPNLLAKPPGEAMKRKTLGSRPDRDEGMKSLPRMSKFILVAAFLASTNPTKSDLRMFGRGLDEKKRKRRATKATGKAKSGPAKIPQRLVGPAQFHLDRLIAILGALLEENDVEIRPPAPPEYTVPGEYTDMETSRVGIYSSIMELTSMRLLHRTSHPDRIDGPPAFKCGISYDVALSLARQLDIPLNDLMWDPI